MEYNRQWPVLFQKEAQKIKEILADELVNIYHIGSTAVENLKAKPIIDIMPVVREIALVDNFNGQFVKIGYEPMGEFGLVGRRYFRKGAKIRTHHVHVYGAGSVKEIERHLAFRDYLRAHPQDALDYGQLKSRLAAEFPFDKESYMEGKDFYVKELEKKAVKWYRISRRCRKGL